MVFIFRDRLQNTLLPTSSELVGAHAVSVHDGVDFSGGGGGITPTQSFSRSGGDGGTTIGEDELETGDDID